MAASYHTRKRQYQPSNQTRLTSFFGGDANTAVRRPAISPELPPDVAANLLSVGMRVRKSVPEGYKNKAPVDVGFPFPSSASPLSHASTRPSVSLSQTRELVPFCGLHKTGGWGAQEVPTSSAPAAMQTIRKEDIEDDLPELSMSQSTMRSSQGSSTSSRAPSSSRKRTFEEETEAFMDDMFDELDNEVIAPYQAAQNRPMAKAKSTSSKRMASTPVRIFGSDDFEEAAFLVPLDSDIDMDR